MACAPRGVGWALASQVHGVCGVRAVASRPGCAAHRVSAMGSRLGLGFAGEHQVSPPPKVPPFVQYSFKFVIIEATTCSHHSMGQLGC